MAMSLKLLSSPINFAGEHEMVEAMFEAGLAIFHLRKPELPETEVERWLLALDADWRGRVVVHGFPELARNFDLAGCHMPMEWFKANRHCGDEFSGMSTWSVSTHSFEEIRQCSEGVSECFISPVFDSISKHGYMSAFTDAEIREGLFLARARTASVPRIFALGGVDAEKLGQVAALGFDGAAVLGAVWDAPDPVGALDEILKAAEACGA